jgi:hydrogenase maturation protein HypF
MLKQMINDTQAKVAVGKMAMRFHRALANVVRSIANLYPQVSLTLSGGCFQNRVLLHLVQELDLEKERNVAWPGRIPVNDSGIAIGQTLAALAGEIHHR